jgi:hypothetical protein
MRSAVASPIGPAGVLLVLAAVASCDESQRWQLRRAAGSRRACIGRVTVARHEATT